LSLYIVNTGKGS